MTRDNSTRARRIAALTLGALGGLVLAPLSALAATPAPDALPLAQAPSTALALVRVLGALALVLGVFFAGLWCFRNWERLALRRDPMRKLMVCEARSLGQRHTLYVIGYEEQRLLVAASPTGVTLLTALPPGATAQELARQPQPAASPNFAALVLQALGRRA